MPLQLKIEEEGKRRAVELSDAELTIGRGGDNGVVINDPRSSRRHCRLLRTPQGLILEDMESRNGTLLNGAQVKKSFLKPGDEFRVGNVRFILQDGVAADGNGEEAAPAAAPVDEADGAGPEEIELAPRSTHGDSTVTGSRAGTPSGAGKKPPAVAQPREVPATLPREVPATQPREVPAAPPRTATSVSPPAPPASPPSSRSSAPASAAPPPAAPSPAAPAPAGSARAASASPAAAGEFRLEGLEGDHAGEKVSVPRTPFVMGRARDCDFQLKDQRASGRHAQIVREGSRYYLEDLGSTNGTLLNKRPVQRAPLAAGSVIQIGNSGFRVRLPADARGAAAAPAGDGEFVEFDVEKFLAADRTQHPLAVGALLLILAAVGYFSIDIALRLSRKRDADPPPEASLITGNWSFEETKPGGTATEAASAAVPGWRVAGGDQGSIASVEAHAQVPGRRALRLEANGDPDLCRAVHATDLVLGGDRLFRLEGFVHNEGAFAAGFLVEWLGAAKDVPVERALTETARERGEEIDVNQVFAAPPSASQARISCFVLGERGAAVFDRIAFVPAPGSTPGPVAAVRPGPGGEARTAGAAGGEAEADAEGDGGEGADRVPGSGRRAFRCGEEGELKVELESDGTFALHRPRRQLIPALWAGSPPDRDPLGFGPRLALARIGSEDEGSALLTGEVPDVKESSWLPLETTVRRSGKDVAIRWRTGVTAPGATPPALAAYLHTREPWSPVAAVVSGGEAATGNGTVEAGKDGAPATLVKEVVIGQGEERVSLVFPSPVVVSTVPHPFDASRTLLVLASDGPEVEVVVSEGSREESFLARGLLQSAEEAYRNGQAGAAVKLIAQLRERYPQDKAAIERAAELLAAWKRLAAEEVAALEREGAVLKETSSPVVKDLILRRAAALRERLAGAPEAEEAARVAAEVEAQWSQRLRTRKEAELRSWLEQAQKHLSAEDLGLAEVYFRCVAEGDPEGELGRTARARLKTIEGRLTTRVNILLQ